jgi:hypothetical protein
MASIPNRSTCQFSKVEDYITQYNQIIIGNINLSNVNLRPDKVNQILQSLTIPFAMRAGTIGKLDLKVS